MSALRYRPEIDGLRALAVVPVVLFHAGFSLFAGGFVGVDVFFVISGYLITSIILAEQAAGNYSILKFYERRARRILPPLYLVMLCTLPPAFLWLWPGDMKEFAQSLIHTCMFISNLLFNHKSGYFDSAAAFKPLLHTWSLSVEEQYYVFFPPLVMLINRYRPHLLLPALGVIALASLGFCSYIVQHNSGHAYYLLQSRMWELMIGSLLACYHRKQAANVELQTAGLLPSSTLVSSEASAQADEGAPKSYFSFLVWGKISRDSALALLGLLLILASMFLYNETYPYPSFYTLAPTIGAALIIAYARPHNLVGKLLALRLMVGIGLISYSVYLWHQPLFVFARIAGYTDAGLWFFGGLSLLTLLLGYLSWRFVETPFRDAKRVSRLALVIFVVVSTGFFYLLGSHVNGKKGFVREFTPQQKEIYDYKQFDYHTPWREGTCFLKEEQTYENLAPLCRHYNARPRITVWGDSYAAALVAGWRKLNPNVTQLTANRCPPLVAGYVTSERKHCADINRAVFDEIVKNPPDILLLQGNWMFYQLDKPAPYLQQTVALLREKLPRTRIYVLGNLPQWSPSLPDVMLRNKLSLADARPLKSGGLVRIRPYDADLRAAAVAGGATFLSAIDAMCEGDFCTTTATYKGKTELATWDYGHPTVPGSIYLLQKLLRSELR